MKFRRSVAKQKTRQTNTSGWYKTTMRGYELDEIPGGGLTLIIGLWSLGTLAFILNLFYHKIISDLHLIDDVLNHGHDICSHSMDAEAAEFRIDSDRGAQIKWVTIHV